MQVVAIVEDDAQGSRKLALLAGAGVGHAAVLRGPARPIEAPDLDLAIRYLPEVRVAIAVDLAPATLPAFAELATYAGATAIVVETPALESVEPGEPLRTLPDDVIVLAAPTADPDGTFAGFVAAFAVRLDAGEAPADAWNATLRALAVDVISADPGRRTRPAAR